jgi:hypothetical protein
MLETIDFFFFSPTRLGIARAVSHKSRHESHCGLQKTSLYLHESGPRVNKHLGEFNDFSTICGKSALLSTLIFRHFFVTVGACLKSAAS